MNKTSVKYLGLAFLLLSCILSGGCRNSILHKEGAAYVAREAVAPITRSLDKLTEELELAELSKEIALLTGDIRVLVNNLEETRGESTELIKTAHELLSNINELTPKVNELISNVNSLIEDTKNELDAGTTESIPWKLLSYILIGIGILVSGLILFSVFKRK